MIKPLKPVGMNPKQSAEWKRLTEWNEDDVPPNPGTYQIRYAPNGTPTDLNLTPDDPSFTRTDHARCDDLTGVLYIGKAVSFEKRFCKLLETWKRLGASDKSKNHESYETWLSKQLQSKYPVQDMQFRYMPISKEVWKKPKKSADKLPDALWCQDGRSADSITSSAAYAKENTLLRKYFRCFGTLPPLNTMGPQIGIITDQDMERILEDLGKRDCALNDPDDCEA